jgi:hypothetical protein
MATAQEFRIEQLWLDVDRPIQPRQKQGASRVRQPVETINRQMELRMTPPKKTRPPERPVDIAPQPAPALLVAEPEAEPVEGEPVEAVALPFGGWLLEQGNRRGTLGELAKAARLDRQFPRKGSVEEVRARFNAAGADGDAFEALDDAERDFYRNHAES